MNTIDRREFLRASSAAMTLAWCLAAWLLVDNPTLGKPARLYGHRALPFVLIGLGGFILYTSGAIDLLASLVRP